MGTARLQKVLKVRQRRTDSVRRATGSPHRFLVDEGHNTTVTT